MEVDYCPKCLGLWFEEDELRQAKDEKDNDLIWLDIDLWKDEKDFAISKTQKVCPVCEVPFYEVNYGSSKIKVNVCNLCRGVWLERGEFKEIIDYLKSKGKDDILNHYLKTLAEEGIEMFTGPEAFREEVRDFFKVLKLLNYKFAVQHSVITKIIEMLPK